jgi:Protein of unknown function (DUF4199)
MKQIIAYLNHPFLKIPLLIGFTTGVLGFVYFLALYALEIPPLGNHKSLDFGINIIAMTAAVWYYRKTAGHGMLHFWEGLSICYIVNTVGALVTGWFIYFFVTQADPDVFTQYITNSLALLQQGKADIVKTLGADQFAVLVDKLNKTQPADLIADEVSKKTVLAILPAFIISLVLRKQEYSVLNP